MKKKRTISRLYPAVAAQPIPVVREGKDEEIFPQDSQNMHNGSFRRVAPTSDDPEPEDEPVERE